MRQLFLSFTFILIILPFAKSQTLTVKQVYDFQVNDVFIYSSTLFQNTNPPPSYYTHDEQIKISILERWESDSRLYYKREISTLDYYHLHTNSGSYPSSDKWDTTFTRQLDTLILTNLDSNVLINVRKCEPQDSIFPICIYKDSSFALGNMFNGRTTISRSFLIAPPHFIDTSNYTKGLGLTYYNHIYTPSGGGYQSIKKLIYYHKGSETWGKPFTTKTNDPSVLSLKIELSPNPSSGILKISTSELFDNIKIMNLSGKVVFNDKNVPTTKCQIVLQDLPNGLYFAQVFKNQTLISIGKFVLNR